MTPSSFYKTAGPAPPLSLHSQVSFQYSSTQPTSAASVPSDTPAPESLIASLLLIMFRLDDFLSLL